MLLHPEVQEKAHKEIDEVVGRDRLPGFQDRDRLPYINAICSELLRWMPPTPLALPRFLLEDDEYNGYFLPKGTMFITNAWCVFSDVLSYRCAERHYRGLLHDPERYPAPDKFDPERYLKPEPEQDPRLIAFGYGRRRVEDTRCHPLSDTVLG